MQAAPDEVISRRAGSMVYDLRVTGRRAHSQVEPEKGRNAILELCHKVIEAHKIVGDDDVLLISVATVEGGPASGDDDPGEGSRRVLENPEQPLAVLARGPKVSNPVSVYVDQEATLDNLLELRQEYLLVLQ